MKGKVLKRELSFCLKEELNFVIDYLFRKIDTSLNGVNTYLPDFTYLTY